MNKKIHTRKIIIASLFVVTLLQAAVCGQEKMSEENTAVFNKSLPVFTRLLSSEAKARDYLTVLSKYESSTENEFASLVYVAQRLLVAELDSNEVMSLIQPCADAAKFLGGDDEEFAEIALTIGGMKVGAIAADAGIVSLSDKGLPVYKMLGEAIGRSPEQVKQYLVKGNIKGKGAADALLVWFKKTYGA